MSKRGKNGELDKLQTPILSHQFVVQPHSLFNNEKKSDQEAVHSILFLDFV